MAYTAIVVVRKNQSGFSAVGLVIAILVIGALVFVGRFYLNKKNHADKLTSQTNSSSAPVNSAGGESGTSSSGSSISGAGKKVLFQIKDSGSTNTKGWYLIVYTDGSGTIGSKNFPAKTFDAVAIKQALDSTGLRSTYGCMRSASFGSIETLVYKSKKTTGFDCFLGNNSPLAKNINIVLQKAGV